MQNDAEQRSDGRINRRSVLKGAAAASVAGVVGVPALGGGAVAQSTGEETLYLSDSGLDIDDGNGSKLFEVDLDDANQVANLTLLAELDDELYDQVDALAATPDGSTVYAIDKFSKHLGAYDVNSGVFTDRGEISGLPDEVVQAAFSPDGVFYVSSDSGDDLYVVDPSVPEVTDTVDLADDFDMRGADIVFDAAGTLFIFTNGGDGNGPGLYKIDSFASATEPISPDFVGAPAQPYFTGLAIRAAGTGDLVGSTHTTSDGLSQIFTIDPTDGSKILAYDTEQGTDYDVGYGDMTVGALDTCEDLTLDLCAGQDIDVGTVTVSEFGGALSITYDLDEPWLLCESHVDIGDEFDDLHTNGPGNPQVGQFDLSEPHDCTDSFTYTVECDSEALSDVDSEAETLYIAVHGVVQNTETDAEETAWVCEDQDGVSRFVEQGNWATYFTYDLCGTPGGLDLSCLANGDS
ncbi:MAG: YncE family protein [Haloferacaceae archaeon]